ncbi:MAG: hypothetical protein V2B18_07015, partial [Pseudomonadota bacterium]
MSRLRQWFDKVWSAKTREGESSLVDTAEQWFEQLEKRIVWNVDAGAVDQVDSHDNFEASGGDGGGALAPSEGAGTFVEPNAALDSLDGAIIGDVGDVMGGHVGDDTTADMNHVAGLDVHVTDSSDGDDTAPHETDFLAQIHDDNFSVTFGFHSEYTSDGEFLTSYDFIFTGTGDDGSVYTFEQSFQFIGAGDSGSLDLNFDFFASDGERAYDFDFNLDVQWGAGGFDMDADLSYDSFSGGDGWAGGHDGLFVDASTQVDVDQSGMADNVAVIGLDTDVTREGSGGFLSGSVETDVDLSQTGWGDGSNRALADISYESSGTEDGGSSLMPDQELNVNQTSWDEGGNLLGVHTD